MKLPKLMSSFDAERLMAASAIMGREYVDGFGFVATAMEWLAAKYGDLHVEFHKGDGWQVSSCFDVDGWGDGWMQGDGTLAGALCEAVEKAT